MAGLKRCLGVDLGGHSVKLVEMAVEKKKVRILRMVSAPVPIEPGALESERIEAVTATVRQLVKTHKITTKRAFFSMPGQTVFVRRQRLPRAPGPRLHQIIQFEARQVIPFPLEKTMLEYQVFDTEDEREVEVLLVAMKKETNVDFIRSIKKMGLKMSGVGISTLALFNGEELRRFNLEEWLAASSSKGIFGGGKDKTKDKKKKAEKPKKDKKKKKKKKKKGEEEPEEVEIAVVEEPLELEEEDFGDLDFGDIGADMEFEEVFAYVNLGARCTDLAICKSGGSKVVGFTRSIPIGGTHVSSAIFKECGCENFSQAEEIKQNQAAIQSGDFEIEADPTQYNESASKAATMVYDRIISELRRSLDFFISQPDGVAVDKIILSGGGARMAFLPGYIEERLGVPAEIDEGLGTAGIDVAEEYAADFDYAPFKIAIGLASQGLGIAPLDIDFVPADIKTMRNMGPQYVEFAALAGIIVAMVVIGSSAGEKQRGEKSRQFEEVQSKIDERTPYKQTYDAAKQGRTTIDEKYAAMKPAIVSRDLWLRVVSHIQTQKPAGVVITRLECKAGADDPAKGTVIIEGESDDQNAGSTFIRVLQDDKSSEYLRNVIALSINQRLVASKLVQAKQVYTFSIQATVVEKSPRLVTRLRDWHLPVAPPEDEFGSGDYSEEGLSLDE